jgi:nicotinate phosphoribosyltransferase
MSIFNQERLTNKTFKLDIERLRQGWYSDKYFENIGRMLTFLAAEAYTYDGKNHNLPAGISPTEIEVGNMEVEMQWFTRRKGKTVVVGVDKAVSMLKHCSGYWDNDEFITTKDKLDVWAVHDGATVEYDGDPLNIQPVLRVHGRYRDFALLETPTVGSLTRSSRVATNVYETMIAARGKPILFFPARFDLHETQAADGYAYNLAVHRFNRDYAKKLGAFVSTDSQGDWWGGAGGGTVAHAAVASFLGDTAETMLQFARILPVHIPRIALVDFNNDSVADALATLQAMFTKYRELVDANNEAEAPKFILYGIRLDTSGSLRDISVPPSDDPKSDLGVTPRLVFNVHQALNTAWEHWDIPEIWQTRAREYCQNIKIVVSGGFNPEKIKRFEKLGAPVDIYAVGSYYFNNHENTRTDFTADVVRVKVHGQWVDMAKVGRAPCENPDLERVW